MAMAGDPPQELRLSRLLRARLLSDPAGEIELVVRLRPGIGPGDLASFMEPGGPDRQAVDLPGGAGARYWPEIRRLHLRLPAVMVEALGRSPAVEWIEERHEERDRDENDGIRRALGQDQLVPFPGTFRGRGVKVGAWEAGHPDTETRSGTTFGHDDLSERVQVVEESDVKSHATQVAGTLLGDGRASAARGGEPYQWQGVAPEAQLFCYSTTDSDLEAQELISAVQSKGIQVSIHPWGELVTRQRCDLFGDYNIRAAEFDQAIAGEDPLHAGSRSVPVVFSVGNYQGFLDCILVPGGGQATLFPGFRTINPPHTAKNIIAVGAVDSDDMKMTPFSSWGPTDDGRIKPDLVAPGAQRGGDGGVQSPTYEPPDGYRADEGTSYSAAATAGVLAILIGERADRGLPSLPPAAWKAILVESALDLTADPLAGRIPFRGPDYYHGYGMVWLPDAIRLEASAECLIEGAVGLGEERRYPLDPPPGTARVRATLAWDDPAGDWRFREALVNDLDLRILEEFVGGIVRAHQPWVLDPQRPDAPATRGPDRINNVEQVEVDAPTGRLTLVVTGSWVPRGPQRFWVALGAGCALDAQPSQPFRRGDANQDRRVDIADSILVLHYLFLGGDARCKDAADANDDGRLDVADGVRILSFLFLGSPSDQPPLGGGCIHDATADRLGCAGPSTCP